MFSLSENGVVDFDIFSYLQSTDVKKKFSFVLEGIGVWFCMICTEAEGRKT